MSGRGFGRPQQLSPLLTVGPLSWELMSTDADLGPDGGSARPVCHHPARWAQTERPTHMVIHLHRAGQGHVCALLIGYGGPRLAEHALVLPTGDLVGSVTNRLASDNRPAASA